MDVYWSILRIFHLILFTFNTGVEYLDLFNYLKVFVRDTFVLLIWLWTMRPTMCRSTGFAHVGILTSFREDARIQFKPFLPPFVPRIVASTIIARRWQMKRAGERFSCTVMREWRCCAWGKSGEVVNDLRMGWVEEKKMKRNWLFGLQEEEKRG